MNTNKCAWPACRREVVAQCTCRKHVCAVHDGRVSVATDATGKHHVLGGWCPQCRWSAR